MEKYRKYADHGTGIQPFIPASAPGSFAAVWGLGSVLVLIRLPMVVVVSGIVMISILVSALLSLAVPALGRLVEAVTMRPALRILLFSCGYNTISEQAWPLTARAEQRFDAKPGDVILVNFTGYMDILIQASLRSAVFGFAQDFHGKPEIITRGHLGAFRYAVQSYQETKASFDPASARTLAEASAAAKRVGRPLVLFFEGTATNGRGILAPPKGLLATADCKTTAFHVVAHVHHALGTNAKPRASAVYPVSDFTSPLGHLVRLISVPSHYLRVVSVLPSATPAFSAYPDANVLQTRLMQTLSEASGLPLMSKTREDKAPFLQHWQATQGTDYVKG